jgi:hypothetical protein
MNANEARAMWAADRPILEAAGVVFAGAETYRCEDWGYDHRRVPSKYWGYDAQPALTSVPNAGIPSFLTLTVDPEVNEILFARTQFSKILGEVKRGDWTAQTALFPTIEHTGEVSSYNDYSENGVAGLNAYWPQRQSYLFQLIKRYGELELDRAALAKINWASEIDQAAATVMQQFLNYTYGFGVAGLQNYGILNDPALPASVTPGTKTAGNGNVWIFNGTVNATANEVFADIQALFIALVAQTGGILKQDDEVVLALVAVILAGADRDQLVQRQRRKAAERQLPQDRDHHRSAVWRAHRVEPAGSGSRFGGTDGGEETGGQADRLLGV